MNIDIILPRIYYLLNNSEIIENTQILTTRQLLYNTMSCASDLVNYVIVTILPGLPVPPSRPNYV